MSSKSTGLLALLVGLVLAGLIFGGSKVLTLSHQNANVVARVARLGAQNSGLLARVTADERRTCQIQASGLPAGHELAASMRAIHALLTLPPSPDAPPVPPRVTKIVKTLNRHLTAYLAAEASLPDQRSC